MSSSFQRARVKVAVVTAAILVTCVFTELGLRVYGAYAPPVYPPRPAQPDVYQPDPDVGYRLWPSKTSPFRYPRRSGVIVPVTANSDGFRNSREFDEHDGRARILVIGDSFTFGLGVRAEDRFTEQLETSESGWRVDNMAMPGWGLDLMVRALERYGRKADPDIVVLAIYSGDFWRLHPYFAGAGYALPKFAFAGSELVTVPYPSLRRWHRLRLVQLLYQTAWNLDRDRYDLNEALLDRYLKDAGTVGFAPAVMFLPEKTTSAGDSRRRHFLGRWTSRNRVPYLDLTDAIRAVAGDDIYIEGNIHWNQAGHRLAATELRVFLAHLLYEDPQ